MARFPFSLASLPHLFQLLLAGGYRNLNCVCLLSRKDCDLQQCRWVIVLDKEMVWLSESQDGAVSLASLLAGGEDKVSVETRSLPNTTARRWTCWSGQGGSICSESSGSAQTQCSDSEIRTRLPEADLSRKPSVSPARLSPVDSSHSHSPPWLLTGLLTLQWQYCPST